jgi:hypothetical protein
VPDSQNEFVADNARFFTEPLPGRDEPGGPAAEWPPARSASTPNWWPRGKAA